MASNIPEETVPTWMTTSDPAELRRYRACAKSSHTKAITALMEAIRAGDHDAVEERRRRLVSAYTEVDQRHQRYVRYAVFTPTARSAETQWLTNVGVEYTSAMTAFDEFKAPDRAAALSYQVSRAASSSRRSSSSHQSALVALRAQLREAELAERQAEVVARQQRDEHAQREQEDVQMRQIELSRRAQREQEDAEMRQIELARRERAANQDAEQKRLARELLKAQLEQEEALSILSRLYGTSSVHSSSSHHNMVEPTSLDSDDTPSCSDLLSPTAPRFFSAESMLSHLPRANGPATLHESTTVPSSLAPTPPPVSWFVPFEPCGQQLAQPIQELSFDAPAPSCATNNNQPTEFTAGRQALNSSALNRSAAARQYIGLPPSTTSGQGMTTTSDTTVRPKVLFRSDHSTKSNGPALIPVNNLLVQQSTGSASMPQHHTVTSTRSLTTTNVAQSPLLATYTTPCTKPRPHSRPVPQPAPSASYGPATGYQAPQASYPSFPASCWPAASYAVPQCAYPTVTTYCHGAVSLPPTSTSWMTGGQPTVLADALPTTVPYSPDAWIGGLSGTAGPTASPTFTHSSHQLRPPKPILVTFSGQPRDWPTFIQGFKVQVHDTCSSDWERQQHLKSCLPKQIQDSLGEHLLNPGLYNQALTELQRRFGNRQAIVRSCVSLAMNLKPLADRSATSLMAFSATLRSVVATLKLSGFNEELYSCATLSALVGKLPAALRSKWAEHQWALQSTQLPSIVDFDRWLDNLAMAEHSLYDSPLQQQQPSTGRSGRQQNAPNKSNRRNDRTGVFAATVASNTCPCCNGGHQLHDCRRFKDLPVDKRVDIIRKSPCCLRCLKTGHFSGNCEQPEPCKIAGCTDRHHTLLHGAPRIFPKKDRNKRSPRTSSSSMTSAVDTMTSTTTTAPSISSATFSGSTSSTSRKRGSMLPIVPVVLKANGRTFRGFGLLDPGSEVSFVTEEPAKHLQLTGPTETTAITTVLGTEANRSMSVNLQVMSVDGSASFHLQDVLTVKSLNLSTNPVNLNKLRTTWRHLAGIQLEEHEPEEVCVLIGMDQPAAHMIHDVRFDPANQRAPRANLTSFGWCLVGPLSRIRNEHYHSYRTSASAWEDNHFEEMVSKFLRGEDFATKPDVKPHVTPDVARASQILERAVRHNGERYESPLLHRNDTPSLENNHDGALRRFLSLERRLLKDESLAVTYTKGMDEYIARRFVSKLTPEEAAVQPAGRTNYLPHHPVFYPNKPGKIRIVFDAAFKYRNSSLNGNLLAGPDLLTGMIGVLFRFRLYQHAIVGDIERMFHQVLVKDDDRDALRFFWRRPGDTEPPDTYRWNVQIFGSVCSPAICAHALRLTAKASGREDIMREVLLSTYVDNWLRSYRTKEEAIVCALALHAAFARGGFNLTQFSASCATILSAMPDQRQATSSVNLDLDAPTIERTLGQCWDFRRDCFVLKISGKNLNGRCKRDLLRTVASIFDPLGFLAPVLITAKILLQDVWRSNADWDDTLSTELLDRWRHWGESLHSLESLAIPRCYTLSRETQPDRELHIFSDASKLAYGSCAYLVSRFPDEVITSLVIAKSRVAPVKFLTTPRLELSAAVLGVRIMLTVQHELSELNLTPEKTFLWTDSTTVLRWINSDSSRLPVFVANRVSEILESTETKQWWYVPTDLNPADDVSRGLDTTVLNESHRWFIGPSFLHNPPEIWPTSPLFPALDDEDPSPDWAGVVAVDPTSILDRIVTNRSDLSRIKRIVGYLVRWTRNARPKVYSRKDGPLDADELQHALDILVRRAQHLAYAAEIRTIDKGRPIEKSSRLSQLTPFLNEHGILCVGGRLDKAPLSFGARHPILLPPLARITELLVWQTHLDNAHAAVEATLQKVRNTYWIPRGNQTVKRVISPCIRCALFRARTVTPRMADLPSFRLGCSLPAFANTGVDLFGPYNVKVARSYHKRWVCLFTCGTTRAVHLEVVKSMSTDSFINAMVRFESLRGRPIIYQSDNGTNFVGARRELNDCWASIDAKDLADKLAGRGVHWQHNPPSAPHMGGVWEALVRSAKRALHFILDGRTLDDETFCTAVAHVAGLLNSRPLTVINEDPTSPEPLTPNHLLIGRASPMLPPGFFPEQELSSRKRWRAAQAVTQLFWERWQQEYAPTLMERRKWATNDRNLRAGDVVAIMDRKNPRGRWQIGRVARPVTAADGIVRSAWILIPKTGCEPGNKEALTELHRPAVSLALLEPYEEELSPDGDSCEPSSTVPISSA